MKKNSFITPLILLTLISFVYIFNPFEKISTKMDTLLPNGEQKELLKSFNNSNSSKKLFIAYRGFTKESLEEIQKIEKELLEFNELKPLQLSMNNKLKNYIRNYGIYKQEINYKSLDSLNIEERLKRIKKEMRESYLLFSINKNDPLNIFEKTQKNRIKLLNNHLIIENYGYLLVYDIDKTINSLDKYEILYDKLLSIKNEKTTLFSPIFYFVENSRIMKSDINTIILYSTLILILLYLVLLKNIKLLFHTYSTQISSILFSLLILSMLFEEISIFALVFGISISTVSIDYMFHHYFHGYYEGKKGFNKEVFFGMITTCGAFFIISFVSFELIKQISLFAIFSLLFSYTIFSFLYPLIGFKKEYKVLKKEYKVKYIIKTKYITLLSIILILFLVPNIKFNLDIKDLDIQNENLKKSEELFSKTINNQETTTLIIKAKSIDELINLANRVKNEFKEISTPLNLLVSKEEFYKKREEFKRVKLEKIKKKLELLSLNVGFKKGYFNSSYNTTVEYYTPSLKDLKEFGITINRYKDYYISYITTSKSLEENLYQLPFIEPLSLKYMFMNHLKSITKEIIILGTLTTIFILFMMFKACKKEYLKAINFILFPFSVILTLSLFISFNILHIFMLFIILAISIDFGIYISSNTINNNTKKAILYSLLSTFAGFGVLIFSHINALFSIGIIATIGIFSISFLLLISKKVF